MREANNRSDRTEPGGDPWRGDGTRVECFNDLLTVQPAVARLVSIIRLTQRVEGRLKAEAHCHRPATRRRSAALAHSE
jgi:hypothetical protein